MVISGVGNEQIDKLFNGIENASTEAITASITRKLYFTESLLPASQQLDSHQSIHLSTLKLQA
jgi:hypothetical protein